VCRTVEIAAAEALGNPPLGPCSRPVSYERDTPVSYERGTPVSYERGAPVSYERFLMSEVSLYPGSLNPQPSTRQVCRTVEIAAAEALGDIAPLSLSLSHTHSLSFSLCVPPRSRPGARGRQCLLSLSLTHIHTYLLTHSLSFTHTLTHSIPLSPPGVPDRGDRGRRGLGR